MYEIIRQVIVSGDYELSDMIDKIKKNCIRGDITDEQETELIALARENATPENSYAGLQTQVDELREIVYEITQEVYTVRLDVDAIKKALEECGTDVLFQNRIRNQNWTSIQNMFNRQERMTHTTPETRSLGTVRNMSVK